MRNILFLMLCLVYGQKIKAQEEMVPSIDKMQGLWSFKDINTRAYMIIRQNKAILIINSVNENESNCYGNPFSYFGFWDSGKHNDEEPKHLSQLESSGRIIHFYDDLGTEYDKEGNLLHKTRQCWMTINEDSDDPNPSVLRFYYKGTPDVYTKVKQIPANVLKSLKKNAKDWKLYVDFMGIIEKRVTAAKAAIFKTPANDQLTKMYLIKGDEVEVLQQNNLWVKIRYYGKTTIEGWIKKKDLE